MVGVRVSELVVELAAVLAELDPEELAAEESLALFESFVRIERMGAAGKVLCARRVSESKAWYPGGHRSPCHLIAGATGCSLRHALDLLEASEALRALPATEARLRAGALGERQVIEVSSAAVLDQASEADLLELAESESFLGRQRAAARVRAAATDEEQRHRRAHRRRHFRHWVDVEGCFRFAGSLTPEAGAVLLAGMEPHRQALSRHVARRPDPEAAVAADALVAMARAASGPADAFRPSAVVHVRVDHSALVRGRTARGEVCEVPGAGPVPVGWVQRLLPDAVVAALAVEDGQVLKVAHVGRVIPAKVRTALAERDRACVVPGCPVDRDLEIDHVTPLAEGGRTELANLRRRCCLCNYLKTHHRWRLSRRGRRWLWEGPHGPPPDPRARQPELAVARC